MIQAPPVHIPWRDKYPIVHIIWSYQYTMRRVIKDWWLTR